MSFIIDNWYIIFALVVLVIFAIYGVYSFIKLPKSQKIDNVKQFLKYAVLVCERELGSKTGQAKLAMCYSLAIEKFPWIASIIPFETFSSWVDEALEWLNHQLDTNVAISNFVNEGGKKDA